MGEEEGRKQCALPIRSVVSGPTREKKLPLAGLHNAMNCVERKKKRKRKREKSQVGRRPGY